jgi:hypothetical protein
VKGQTWGLGGRLVTYSTFTCKHTNAETGCLVTRFFEAGCDENKRNRCNTAQKAPRQLATRSGSYLIPAFNQIQQEQGSKFPFSRQEHQVVAVYFNRGRSYMLVRIATQPD